VPDPDRFQQLFGSAIVQLAHADLTHGIEQICGPLLRRHQCFSEVISPGFGRWYRVFGAKASVMTVDMQEQIPVLQETGAARIRDLLIGCFGQASGSRLNFSFVITEAPESLDSQSIHQIIEQALHAVPGPFQLQPAITGEAVQTLIARGELLSYFQPIVALKDEKIVGYEALTRGPLGTPLHEADPLFGAARQFGLTEELELACLKQAISWLAFIPEPLWISVNLGPKLFMSSEFRQYLLNPAIKPVLSRVVFELTEHLPIESAVRLHATVAGFLDEGIRLSLDDTGCGFFDLTTVEELRPEIVKLCITVVSRIGRSEDIEREIRATIKEVARLGGLTLGEGVEFLYQVEALKQYGAILAQGNFFGIPRPAGEIFQS
jgi:EAL domain-containing protein (putative c-di-GMP-specific phosphodiesterase class I)